MLWGMSWTNLMLMLADAPGYTKKKKPIKKGTKADMMAMMNKHYGKT